MSLPPTEEALAELLETRTLELCRVASVIGQEERLADEIERWGRAHFSADEVFRIGNTLAFGPRLDRPAGAGGSSRRPVLALFGHLDTVPPHSGDPEPHLEEEGTGNRRVVGLGASDMKGGLVLMQLAAERFDRRALPFELVLVFYEREEGPYAENGLGPLFEARPDLRHIEFAICLEPSDNTIHLGCCGALHATLTFEGRSAHSARPWQGENAIHKAGSLLADLHQRAPVEVQIDGLLFREVMTATLAQGGRARNVVPESFTVNLNYRFAPGKSVEAAQDDVTRFVAGRARVAFTDLAPSGAVAVDNPLLRRLRERTGAAVHGKQAWTDVGRLSSLGIAAVNFGPGEGAQAHQARESVSVRSLVEGWHLLSRFLSP